MPARAVAEPGAYAGQSDEWLVARHCESADEAAFAELVRRYRDRVFRLAVSVLGQEFAADAEDVAQEVLVRVHQSLRTFRNEARFGTWIYRIAFNHALNLKARVRYRQPHEGEHAFGSMASLDSAPDELVEAERRKQVVLACVTELPEVYQSALRLHYWLGTSVRDIAVMLDVPENTVKSYLHRGRQLLRAMLAERGIDAG